MKATNPFGTLPPIAGDRPGEQRARSHELGARAVVAPISEVYQPYVADLRQRRQRLSYTRYVPAPMAEEQTQTAAEM